MTDVMDNGRAGQIGLVAAIFYNRFVQSVQSVHNVHYHQALCDQERRLLGIKKWLVA